MSDYSVLMSVYFKENPSYLKRSIESILAQTVMTNDFVVVCDGPLTEELDAVLADFKKQYGELFNIVRREKNEGLGIALQNGLLATKNEIVMRMDSDDASLADRAEKQLPYMEKYDLVGGFISEFDGEETNIIGIRKVPENYAEIRRFAKKRCPFNHPSVMYKKSAVIAVGSYRSFLFLEDYDLWIRFIHGNYNVYNMQTVLVNMRSGMQMRARRAGKTYRKSMKNLRKELLDLKMINVFEYVFFVCTQTILLMLPLKLKEKVYSVLFRTKTK